MKQLLPVLKSKINKQNIERTGSSGFIRIVDRFYFRPMHSPKVEKPAFIIKPILKEAIYREKKKQTELVQAEAATQKSITFDMLFSDRTPSAIAQ